jgi:hypothetical protein
MTASWATRRASRGQECLLRVQTTAPLRSGNDRLRRTGVTPRRSRRSRRTDETSAQVAVSYAGMGQPHPCPSARAGEHRRLFERKGRRTEQHLEPFLLTRFATELDGTGQGLGRIEHGDGAEKLKQSNTVCDPATSGGMAGRDQEDRGGSAVNQFRRISQRRRAGTPDRGPRPGSAVSSPVEAQPAC